MLRWIVLLVLLLAIGAAVTAVLLRPQANSGPETGLTPEPASEPASAPRAPEPLGTLPQPDVPVEVVESNAGGGAPDPTAAPDEPTAPAPAVDARLVYFQQKYGGLPRAELKAELAELDRIVEDQQRVLMDQRFQSGIYEVSLPGDPPLPALPPGPDGAPPVSENRAATDPGSGRTENRRASLPFDEYADFYELRAEAAWLRNHAGN